MVLRDEFIDRISKKSGYTKKDLFDILDSMIEVVYDVVKSGEELKIAGLGTLYSIDGPAVSYNPATGERGEKVPQKLVKFKVGEKLKHACR